MVDHELTGQMLEDDIELYTKTLLTLPIFVISTSNSFHLAESLNWLLSITCTS